MDTDRTASPRLLSWQQVRLAAGDVQLILMEEVLRRGRLERQAIPEVVRQQTLIRDLTPRSPSNLQDIADRLSQANLLTRTDHVPIAYVPSDHTRTAFELLVPKVRDKSGARRTRRPRQDAAARTIRLTGNAVSPGLSALLAAGSKLKAGEAAEFRVVWRR